MFSFSPTTRVRPSPFFEAAVAEGMMAANVYNRMIMPTSFGNPEAEYWRLINGVSQWDVGVERQVQLQGTGRRQARPDPQPARSFQLQSTARANMCRCATIAAR